MDLQSNTDYVLVKLDSLFTSALPYLEQGVEEVIRYKLIEFRSAYFIGLFILVFFGFISFRLLRNTVFDSSDTELERFTAGAFSGLITIFILILGAFNLPKLILSFTSPEMFVIMQLVGQ